MDYVHYVIGTWTWEALPIPNQARVKLESRELSTVGKSKTRSVCLGIFSSQYL